MSKDGRLSGAGRGYRGTHLRPVLNVFVKSPILDSLRLPATTNRSLTICCFIGENDDSCGITVVHKEHGAVSETAWEALVGVGCSCGDRVRSVRELIAPVYIAPLFKIA
jgi:hypothetical protein